MSNNGLENENKKERDHVQIDPQETYDHVEMGPVSVNAEEAEDSFAVAEAELGGRTMPGGSRSLDEPENNSSLLDETAMDEAASGELDLLSPESAGEDEEDEEEVIEQSQDQNEQDNDSGTPPLEGGGGEMPGGGSGDLNNAGNNAGTLNNTGENPAAPGDNENNLEQEHARIREELRSPELLVELEKLEGKVKDPEVTRALAALVELDQEEAVVDDSSSNEQSEGQMTNEQSGGPMTNEQSGGPMTNEQSASNLENESSAGSGSGGANTTSGDSNSSNSEQTSTSEVSREETEQTLDYVGELGIQTAPLDENGQEQQTAEQQAEEQEALRKEQEKADGRQAGLDAGRSKGLGDAVVTAEDGEVRIHKFTDENGAHQPLEVIRTLENEQEEKDTYATLEEYISSKQAFAETQSSDYTAGFFPGFNDGYMEGRRLKREKAKRAEDADPEFASGKTKGQELATRSINGEDITAERNQAMNHANSKYRKGFGIGYNQGLLNARRAKRQAEQQRQQELQSHPKYSQGYDLGHQIGISLSKDRTPPQGMTADDVTRIKAYANENKDRNGQAINDDPEKLYSKGFVQGYNKGHMDGRAAKIAARAAAEREMRENPHYQAGEAKGTLKGLFPNIDVMAVLKGEQRITEIWPGAQPVPQSVQEYFVAKTDESITGEAKTLFDRGYSTSYNKAVGSGRTKLRDAREKAEKDNPQYKVGYKIGEIVGKAASISKRLKAKKNRLTRERLAQNPENTTIPSGSEEDKLDKKITNIEKNMTLIKKAITDQNNKYYTEGFDDAYNYHYVHETANYNKQRAQQEENEGSGNSEFDKGVRLGRRIGSEVYQIRKKPANRRPPGFEQKIVDLREKVSKEQSAEFYSGFNRGYNQTALTGSLQENTKDEIQDATNENKQAIINYRNTYKNEKDKLYFFNKASKLAYNIWYNHHKIPENQQLSPEEQWKKKTKTTVNNVDKIIKDDLNDEDTRTEYGLKQDREPKYIEVYKHGIEYGKMYGTTYGDKFKAGFDQAKEGEDAEENGTYYKKGYNLGLRELQYREFRDAVLGTSENATIESYQNRIRTEMEEQGVEKIEGLTAKDYTKAFKQGYNEHPKQWKKIILLKNGLPLPEDLQSESIELKIDNPNPNESDSTSGDTTINNIDISVRHQAIQLLEQKQQTLDSVYAKAEKKMHFEWVNKILTDSGMGEFLDDNAIRQSAHKPADKKVESLIAVYKEGYEKRLQEIENEIQVDFLGKISFTKGFRDGYTQAGATGLPEMEDPAYEVPTVPTEKQEVKYQQGKAQGFNAGTLVKQGLAKPEYYLAQLSGVAAAAAYQRGLKAGEEAGQPAADAIKSGEPMPEKPIADARGDLTGVALQSFDRGFEEGYWKTVEFAQGFIKGKSLALNNDESDDYQRISPSDLHNPPAYQRGLVAGREAGLIQKAGGAGNVEVHAQSAELQRKLNQLREELGEDYAKGYEKGYVKGYGLGSNKSQETNASPLPEQSLIEEGAKTMIEDLKQDIQNKIKATATSVKELLVESGNENNELLKAYNDVIMLQLRSLGQDIKEDKSLSQQAEAMKEALESFLQSFRSSNSDPMVKEHFDDKIERWTQGIDNYAVGYEKGLGKGVTIGLNTEPTTEQNTSSSSFYSQFLQSATSTKDEAYNKGYELAQKNAEKIAKTENIYDAQLLGEKEYKNVLLIRSFIEEILANTSDDAYSEGNNSLVELLAEIIQKFETDNFNLDYSQSDLEQYLNTQTDLALKEITDLASSYLNDLNQNNSLKDHIDALIQKIDKDAKSFLKGTRVGFQSGIQQTIYSHENTEASGGVDVVDQIHDLIEAGEIEDADLDTLEWIDKQDELDDIILSARTTVSLNQVMIYTYDEAIVDMGDEIKNLESHIKLLEEERNHTSRPAKLQSIEDELVESYARLHEVQGQMTTKHELREEEKEEQNEKSKEVIKFIREDLNFDTPQESIYPMTSYLAQDQDSFNLTGTFNDTSGNAQITSSSTGEMKYTDSKEELFYKGNITLLLGDITLLSSGFTRNDKLFRVQLSQGEMLVEKMEGGSVNELNYPYESLDLAIGVGGVLNQISAQLDITEDLNAGSILSEDWFGWGMDLLF